MTPNDLPLVRTIGERCRTCYSCVRGCPAKAIRIANGQADVMRERCIGCGNCVTTCGRKAKEIRSSLANTLCLLETSEPKVACLAPSFPVEFTGTDPLRLAGMLKALGFDYVTEVAFAADMVSLRCRELLTEYPDKRFISSACPAVVSYVEKYHPDLVPNLTPIVSPMVAQARIVRAHYGANMKVVFIGPCIAKKDEACSNAEDIDEAITFRELWQLFEARGVSVENSLDAHFDPPHPAKGVLYPLGGGLISAAEFNADLMNGKFIAVEGLENMTEALKNFARCELDVSFLDILCCNGCLMGPGFTTTSSRYARQGALRSYAQKSYYNFKVSEWERDLQHFRALDYSCSFSADDKRFPDLHKEELGQILKRLGKNCPEDELNCGACGYQTCVEHASSIQRGVAESEMCLPYTIERLKQTAEELTSSYNQLAKTKQALMQSEKLAGMGQLAAGVAHELNNPLGVVLLYAHLLAEQCPKNSRFYKDASMITDQADRCKKIVGGLLNFARKNKPFFKLTDLRKLVDNYFKSAVLPAKMDVAVSHSPNDIILEMDPDQLVQVLTNLVTNASEAMPGGGKIIVETFSESRFAGFRVSDNGCGIKEENRKKIFEPFFTTKQIGKGTGLGLAVSYGIIKVHRGNITVKTNADPAKGPTGTVFTVSLPLPPAKA